MAISPWGHNDMQEDRPVATNEKPTDVLFPDEVVNRYGLTMKAQEHARARKRLEFSKAGAAVYYTRQQVEDYLLTRQATGQNAQQVWEYAKANLLPDRNERLRQEIQNEESAVMQDYKSAQPRVIDIIIDPDVTDDIVVHIKQKK